MPCNPQVELEISPGQRAFSQPIQHFSGLHTI
jgi:hypothetical protein